MAETKWTKGPWLAEIGDRLDDGGDCWVVNSEEGSIAEVQCPADDAEAVARLIAAAPALYEALQEWYRLYYLKGLDGTLRNRMKQHAANLTINALRIVTGETNEQTVTGNQRDSGTSRTEQR